MTTMENPNTDTCLKCGGNHFGHGALCRECLPPTFADRADWLKDQMKGDGTWYARGDG